MSSFHGRLGVQQRVLPSYRAQFFDMLAAACEGGMSLFAGRPKAAEHIVSGELRCGALVQAKNVHLFGGAFYFCWQSGLIGWLEDWQPDALIVEANPRYLATPEAVRWMRGRGRPVIGWGLGSPPLSGPFGEVLRWRWAAFLAQFDALIAYSRRGAAEYAGLGFPSERVFVAHNAVLPRPVLPPAREPGLTRRASVLFVGRLQARKRVDALLRACARMPAPQPRLVIVGDGPERQALEQLAGQVYPQAEFVGARHGEEAAQFYAQADLFVLPGTGGLAVQQAMSYGLPVIVARGDGTQEDLVRPGNGWLVEPEDQEALVATLRAALASRERLRNMGAASYRIVSEEINLEAMVAVFVRALNHICG